MIYYIILAIVLGCALRIPPYEQRRRMPQFMAVVAFIGIICALRDMLGGYDNYIYGEIFDVTAEELRMGYPPFTTAAMTWVHSEKGYGLYTLAIAYFTQNRYIFLFVTAVLFYVAMYFYLKRYSKYPFIALFVFLCLFYFFSWVYIRQTLAVAVSAAAIPYAVNRKPVPFFAIVAAATLMHSSAIMFAPVYFVADRHFTKKQLIGYGVIALLLGLTPVGSFMVNTFGSPINEAKAAETVKYTGGARLDYILEAVFFSVLILVRYEKLKLDKMGVCLLNIAVLFVLTLLMFSRFMNGGRLTWCYIIGVSCIMPEIIVQSGKDTWVKVVSYVALSMLFIRIVDAWVYQLTPYKTFLTNGVRAYDPTWENFEYDHNYDDDKFYKW